MTDWHEPYKDEDKYRPIAGANSEDGTKIAMAFKVNKLNTVKVVITEGEKEEEVFFDVSGNGPEDVMKYMNMIVGNPTKGN